MATTYQNPYASPQQARHYPNILGPLELVTAPTSQPLTLGEIKVSLHVDDEFENQYLDGLIAAATEWCEKQIDGHRQLMLATYDLPVECWWEGALKLPRPPLSSVTSVKYFDSAGTLQTVASSVYLARTPWRMPGTIERAPGQTWPSFQTDRSYPVVIRFVAGYASAAVVPATIKRAVAMVVGHWYERPEALGVAISPELQFSVQNLLAADAWGSYA